MYDINIDLIVGGAVSYDARENLRKFKSIHLSRFETRKIIFDSNSLDNKNLEQALKDAVHFELLWLLIKNTTQILIKKMIKESKLKQDGGYLRINN